MQLIFDHPWYFILLCLLVGAVYSMILYWLPQIRQRSNTKDRTQERTSSENRWPRIAMALIRFVAVSLLAFLLLDPLVKRSIHSHEKPIVVIAQDVSESLSEDERELSWPNLKNDGYEIVTDSFGGKTTDIASALSNIAERYAGRNLSAIVLASDGINNHGLNPLSVATKPAVPIYTIALGDTTHRRDAAITEVRHNRIAYLGNQFPVEITLDATHLKGEHATLSVINNGNTLWSKRIDYTTPTHKATEALIISTDKPGLQHYIVTLTPCNDEANTLNNSRTITVEVLDGHQKIALLAAAAHPDVGALRQAIENNPNYEVQVYVGNKIQELDWNKENFSLVVLHNLPNANIRLPWEKSKRGSQQEPSVKFDQMPTLCIVGTQTDLARLNALHAGIEITAKSQKNDEVTASHNNSFAMFNLDEQICSHIEQLPPLTAPFGIYRSAGNLQSLFYAKIGNLTTDRPMIACCQQGGVRRAFVIGEGLWRWRLHNYLITGSHRDFDQLIEKMVVYASMQTNHEHLRISTDRIHYENGPVVLQAELYNDNYELVNNTPVQCTISHDKENMVYDFNATGSGYTLNLGSLAPGDYNYSAATSLNGHRYTAQGNFAVEAIDIEKVNLVADHTLLNTLAQATGGMMLTPSELNLLPKLLAERDDIKTVVYSHTTYTQMLNMPLLLVLIVILLAAEWGMRKFFFT